MLLLIVSAWVHVHIDIYYQETKTSLRNLIKLSEGQSFPRASAYRSQPLLCDKSFRAFHSNRYLGDFDSH